ncbi:MAG: glycosyltransferase family 9 protein [Ignavibacteriales bacterium]|nr:glycosyltransferase family 9 protein [Ignavibacteriales bacterium]
MNIPDCKHFNGYKPCFPGHNCLEQGCKEDSPMGVKILIINLDAMGDVLMTTAQLPLLKKKYPVSSIYWVTEKISSPLLENNPLLEQVFIYNFESLNILRNIHFDIAVNLDKSHKACAMLNSMHAAEKKGFGLDHDGKIIPVNSGAYYNYMLGLDDNLKFKVNRKTKQEYVAETLDLDYERLGYVFSLTDEEKKRASLLRKRYGFHKKELIVGFNTGCSTLFPNKKMRVDQHIHIIDRILKETDLKVILLGGPEDAERNNEIANAFPLEIISTPTNEGVRMGAVYESLADIIVTGDSFGMHLGIALEKYIVSWFGLSCWTEIDLYDNGVMFYPENLECAPCWKKTCPFNLECIDQINLDGMFNAVVRAAVEITLNRV